jgi:colicin import membrane protein
LIVEVFYIEKSQTMHQKIVVTPFLLVLGIGINAVAKGQASQRDPLPTTSGKENLTTYQHGHVYEIASVNDKTTGLEVDNKRIEPADFHLYDSIIKAIRSDFRQDNDRDADERAQEKRDWEQYQRDQEQAERDREQSIRDRAQAEQDRKQGERDQEQAVREREQDQKQAARDREQGQRDREQGEHDREQGMKDKEQGDRDRAQGQLDREQGQRDREQGERDREAAKEERREMRNFIRELVDEKVIADEQSLNSLIFTNTELVVNGTKQSSQILQKVKDKYPAWAKAGLTYGNCEMQGTSIHFNGQYPAY